MQLEEVNRVFDTFNALYINSVDDVVMLAQGSCNIKIPVQMVQDVIEAIQQAALGER